MLLEDFQVLKNTYGMQFLVIFYGFVLNSNKTEKNSLDHFSISFLHQEI